MLILNVTKLIQIYIACDDFSLALQDYLKEDGLALKDSDHRRKMSLSERLAIMIFYHQSGFKCFKWYYLHVIRGMLKDYFPDAYEYNSFVELMPELNLFLGLMVSAFCYHPPTDANYIDSKKIVVCHNRRIRQNKVFKGKAKRGKSSTGWFYGFKIHLIINTLGQIVLLRITTGNLADNNHQLLTGMANSLDQFIRIFGDRGYLSKIRDQLAESGFYLFARKRKNMQQEKFLTQEQRYYASHRNLIESVFDILKFICDIEHSRHRSPKNFLANLLAAIIAYEFLDLKPSIKSYRGKALVGYQTQDIVLV